MSGLLTRHIIVLLHKYIILLAQSSRVSCNTVSTQESCGEELPHLKFGDHLLQENDPYPHHYRIFDSAKHLQQHHSSYYSLICPCCVFC